MRSTRSFPPRVALVGLAVTALACGDDPAEPEPEPDVAGDYALVEFNGDSLPVTVVYPDDDCTRLTMVAGSLLLEEPDAFSMTQRYLHTADCVDEGEETERIIEGTFAADSAGTTVEITLTPASASDWWVMVGGVVGGRVVLEPEIPAEDRDSEVLRSYVFEQ